MPKEKSKSSKMTRGGITFKKYNSPVRTSGGKKEYAVLAKSGDQVRLVRFGDPNLPVRKNNAKAKKSYCARSKPLGNNKLSANFWSRKRWEC
jgi:hypothetical protein